MTCKGVYASLGFSIYITKDDLHNLLRTNTIVGTAYIGKHKISDGHLRVTISEATLDLLQRAYAEDKEAIRQAKASMASGFLGRKRAKRKW